MNAWIAACTLVVIALAHSALGEKAILQPLFANLEWRVKVSRGFAERTMRFAWHATSLAWLGLGAATLGATSGVVTGIACLATSAGIFVVLRAHLAWPLFLAAGLYALASAGALPRTLVVALAWLAIAVAAGLAVVALARAAGIGLPSAEPRRALRLIGGAAASAAFGALIAWVAFTDAPAWALALVAAGAALMVARTFGARKRVGLLKTQRGTDFARRDDALYVPLAVAMCAGAIAALHLAGAAG